MAEEKATDQPSDQPSGRPVERPVDSKAVAVGHLMAFVYYGKVARVTPLVGGNLDLDVNGIEGVAGPATFSVRGRQLIESAASADYYAAEEKVTKTRAAELLTGSGRLPLTVCFVKMGGEERVLRGRLVSSEPLLGRSYCEDMDLPADEASRKGGRLRLVDHRTIKYLIVGGTRYTVK